MVSYSVPTAYLIFEVPVITWNIVCRTPDYMQGVFSAGVGTFRDVDSSLGAVPKPSASKDHNLTSLKLLKIIVSCFSILETTGKSTRVSHVLSLATMA